MVDTVGFLVWNPSRNLPTKVHANLDRALAEAERLTALHPGERFIIMSPVMAGPDATAAKAWSDGKAEGLAQAHREIMRAEASSDRWNEEAHRLAASLRRLDNIQDNQRRYQAIVADCLLWFDGFAAAFSMNEAWERPSVPDRDTLRSLNKALQDIEAPAVLQDEEIPF